MKAAGTWPATPFSASGRRSGGEGNLDDRSSLAPLTMRVRRALAWIVAIGLGTTLGAIVFDNADGSGASASGRAWSNGAFARHVVVNEIVLAGNAAVAGEVVVADAVIQTPAGRSTGAHGLIAFGQAVGAAVDDPRLLVASVSQDGETVTLDWTLVGTIRVPVLGLDATTEPVVVTGEFVVVVRDGVVHRFVAVVDGPGTPLADRAG